jgi:hypothetical protein
MKKALQVLAGPIIFAMLIVPSSTIQRAANFSDTTFDGEGGPATPGTPDSPLCLPDLPCEPDTPNLF